MWETIFNLLCQNQVQKIPKKKRVLHKILFIHFKLSIHLNAPIKTLELFVQISKKIEYKIR
jgi:hypothetical protein